MNLNFEKLVTAFANKNGLDPKKIAIGGAFEASAVLCSLLHDDKLNKDRFFVYADLGAPPDKDKEAAYLRLLIQNYDAFAVANSRFCISPTNGHAVFIVTMDANTTGLEQLMDEIKGAVALAQEWRKGYFSGFRMGAHV